jgi:hypothetical protein
VIGRLLDLVYGAVPADFESAYSLEESVRRLSATTDRRVGQSPHEAAVGKVARNRVVLRKVSPASSNAFKPHFIGSFRQVGRRVVLSGRFAPALMPKLFMLVWLGMFLWFAWLTLQAGAPGAPVLWQPLFGHVGMFAFGIAAVVVCKRLGRSDIPWLSAVIRNALSAKGVSDDPQTAFRRLPTLLPQGRPQDGQAP